MDKLKTIKVNDLAKRFKGEWLFKSINYTFLPGDKVAILGPNGSGKSTLIKIVSGYMGPSDGSVQWIGIKDVEQEHWHRYYSYCAPYQELIEEFSLRESLDFHFSLKSPRSDVDIDQWLKQTHLAGHMQKLISRFSSGMKQRLKLVLAMATDTAVYFFDEPCSNLDKDGINWYRKKISEIPEHRIIIIASNSPVEYELCTKQIDLHTK